MSYNTLNYTEQGGAVTHIGGKLVFDSGAAFGGDLIPNQAASTASTVADLKKDFNDLLSALKAAGLMAADAD